MSRDLPRAKTPEEAGVSSQAVLNLLDEFEKQGLEYHALMILRHGKVAFEAYRKPYAKDIPHTIYSFSKSVASTAIGFAIDEGLITLETRIGELFPEYRPKFNTDKWDKINLRHVLTMSTGFTFNVFHQNSNPDWVKDYLHSFLRDEPGTVFHYTNENAYLISVIIEKLTGLKMFDYLKPRLFDPLEIEVPWTETDSQGRPAGGWGIQWKLEDSAKFIQCYLNNGKWNGRQVIPEWWAIEATKRQIGNEANIKEDSKVGYGYQFWICSLPNTFACRGMFCNQGVGMRDYDAAFVYFGADADEQKPYDVIYPHFPAGFIDDGSKADKEIVEKLKKRVKNLSFPEPPVSLRYPANERLLSQSVIKLQPQLLLNAVGFPLSFLPMTVNEMALDRAGNINGIELEFNGGELVFSWTEGRRKIYHNSIPAGLDGNYRKGHISLSGFEYDTYSFAYWESPDALVLNIRPIQSCCSRIFRFKLSSGGRVKVEVKSTPSYRSVADNLYRLSFAYLNNNRFLCGVSKIVFGLAPGVMEPDSYGRLIRK